MAEYKLFVIVADYHIFTLVDTRGIGAHMKCL